MLLLAAVLSIVLANTPFDPVVEGLLGTRLALTVGSAGIDKPLLLWINDGLMAVFFLLVGMEIKREIREGVLADPRQIVLPVAGAAGGMIVPAAIYVALNWGNPVALAGWAIPAATDIAFAVGVLAALGSRVPLGLKLFLLTLAIVDDLGAIVIIALFYTSNLSTLSLGLAAACVAILLAFNRAGVRALGPYILVGVVLWVCVLKSGVHATLAGVVLAFCLPLPAASDGGEERPFVKLEHALKPWVAFFIMPVFAFANSGLSLSGMGWSSFTDLVTLGIAAGLFVGKQIGIFAFAAPLVLLGLARLPQGATWLQLYAVGTCAGIGFTMSLFIGTLAFEDEAMAPLLRLGVLSGSLLSAVVGYTLLRLESPLRRAV